MVLVVGSLFASTTTKKPNSASLLSTEDGLETKITLNRWSDVRTHAIAQCAKKWSHDQVSEWSTQQ